MKIISCVRTDTSINIVDTFLLQESFDKHTCHSPEFKWLTGLYKYTSVLPKKIVVVTGLHE